MVYRQSIIAAILLWLNAVANSATYYLATNGNNSADGLTEGTAWQTLTKAGGTMAGGDTLFIRGHFFNIDRTATYAGGTYQWFSPGLHTANPNKGTAEARIIVTNYPGERPIFAHGNLDGVGVSPFPLGNNSWIGIFGLSFSNCRGAPIDLKQNMTNCEVAYCDVGPSSTNIASQSSFALRDHCYFNYIHDNIFHDANGYTAGNVGFNPTNQIENGDTVSFGALNWQYLTSAVTCAFNVFKGNFIYHGGHTAFNPQGCVSNYFTGNVVRNPVFIDWPSFDQKGGHRAAGAFAGWNVYEGNDFGYAGNPLMNDGAEGLGIFGQNNLIFRNAIHHNENNGMSLYSKGVEFGGWFVTNNTLLHNTFVKNSLGQLYFTNLYNAGRAVGIYTNVNRTVIFLSGATNTHLRNNLFSKNGGQGSQLTNSIEFRGGTLAANPEALLGTNWFDHITGNPVFLNDTNDLYYWGYLVGAPLGTNARTEFQLTSASPCKDNAGWLTTCSGDGSGTSLAVATSRYFWPGLTAAGVLFPGSTIQLQGQWQRARVTAIDGATHTLTLDSSLTWTNGQGVSLAYSGNAPDFGAFEYEPPAVGTLSGNITISGGVTIQ